MSAGQVQTKNAVTASATSLSVSLTGVVAGNHLSSTTWSNNVSTTLTTSTPSATWTNAIKDTTHFILFQHDYTENVAGGSWTVTGNVSGASPLIVETSESTGVATSASLGSTNSNLTNSAGTTIQPGSITPAAGSVLYSGAGTSIPTGGTSAGTIDSSFTVDEAGGGSTVWDIGTFNFAAGTAHLNNAAASATNPTWTAGANWTGTVQWGDAFIVEYKAAAAAAAQVPYQPWYQRAPFLAT